MSSRLATPSPRARGEVYTRDRSRDASAPESYLVIARSKATKQSSGAMWASFVDLHDETAALDCFASLAMTTTKRKKEAERRQTCSFNLRISRCGARATARARLSAFHYGSYRQGFRPLGAAPGQASMGRGRTFDPERSLQPGSKDLALLRGRYPRPPVPVQGTHLPDRS